MVWQIGSGSFFLRMVFSVAALSCWLATPVQSQFAPGEAMGYYLLDGYGGVHAVGAVAGQLKFRDFPMDPLDPDRYVGLAITPGGEGLWALDKYGMILAQGDAQNGTLWPLFGWNIARDIEAGSDNASYYILDGFGGVHALGGAAPAPWEESLDRPYFGWDIARDLELAGDGYIVLDGFGGLHPVGSAIQRLPEQKSEYFGWDIAVDFELVPESIEAPGFWQLDGFGGVHVRGAAEFFPTAYFGWDIARDLEILFFPNIGFTYWSLDGYGGVHPGADRTDVQDMRRLVRFSLNHYFGFDIAKDFEVVRMAGIPITPTITPTPSNTSTPTVTFTPSFTPLPGETETPFTPTPTRTGVFTPSPTRTETQFIQGASWGISG